jgi:hypothetical protein
LHHHGSSGVGRENSGFATDLTFEEIPPMHDADGVGGTLFA